MNIDIFKAVTKRSEYRRTSVFVHGTDVSQEIPRKKRDVSDLERLVAGWKQYSYVNLYSKSYLATHIVS